MSTQAVTSQRTVDLAVGEARYAHLHTPAYRTLLKEAGVDIDDVVDLAGFRTLPFTDKHYYRSHYPTGVVALDIALSAEQHVLLSHSSGTGGDRLTTAAYTYDLAQRMSRTTSVHPELRGQLLRSRSQRVVRYAAPNCSDVECASPLTTMESRTLRDGTLVLPVGHDLLATRPSMIEQAIDEIRQYRPDWFYTDATHLAFLLREYRRRGLPAPDTRAVVLTYTLATHVARRQIRAELGPDVPMAEVVSMSELGWVAMECPLGRLHLNSASFFTELLDRRTGAPVAEGGLGELVVTSLRDRLLPHVRYRTGDLYRLMPPCACGSTFLPVRHEGRAVHFLRLPDGRSISPKEFDDVVGPDEGVIAYRMQQRATNRLRFTYIPSPAATAAGAAALRDRVRAAVGDGVRIETDEVDYIPTERTGKFLSCLGIGLGDEA